MGAKPQYWGNEHFWLMGFFSNPLPSPTRENPEDYCPLSVAWYLTFDVLFSCNNFEAYSNFTESPESSMRWSVFFSYTFLFYYFFVSTKLRSYVQGSPLRRKRGLPPPTEKCQFSPLPKWFPPPKPLLPPTRSWF